ncbi:MAG: single-stranded DNA-binding protein [Treponema sp.]|nr:single-stranded DNA-binding protein [Treponema sp.]
MTDINTVILIGNLTRGVNDDERSFGYSANGTARASVSVAVNRSVKKGEEWVDEVSYIDVTIWGKTAENLRPYLVKGQKIAVKGYLKQDRWEKEGQKFSRLSVTADQVQLVGNKKTEDNGGNPAYSDLGNKPMFTPANNGTPSYNGGYEDNGFPEDVPY